MPSPSFLFADIFFCVRGDTSRDRRFLLPQSCTWGCSEAACREFCGRHWTPSCTVLQSSPCWSRLLSGCLSGCRTYRQLHQIHMIEWHKLEAFPTCFLLLLVLTLFLSGQSWAEAYRGHMTAGWHLDRSLFHLDHPHSPGLRYRPETGWCTDLQGCREHWSHPAEADWFNLKSNVKLRKMKLQPTRGASESVSTACLQGAAFCLDTRLCLCGFSWTRWTSKLGKGLNVTSSDLRRAKMWWDGTKGKTLLSPPITAWRSGVV